MWSVFVSRSFPSFWFFFLNSVFRHLRWTFWLQHDSLSRTLSLAPPVHCFGYSGLLWWLGYWLGGTDVITQCLWRQSGWPHLETFFSPPLPPFPTPLPFPHPPPPPPQSLSPTAPNWQAPAIQIYWHRLETQIPSTVLDNGTGRPHPGLWDYSVCVLPVSQRAVISSSSVRRPAAGYGGQEVLTARVPGVWRCACSYRVGLVSEGSCVV